MRKLFAELDTKLFSEPLKSVEVTVSMPEFGAAVTFNVLARLSASEETVRAIAKREFISKIGHIMIGNAYIAKENR